VMEDLADVDGVDSAAFVSPSHEDCEFCKRRWDVQQSALSAAQETFVGHDVRRVPLLAEEVRGETSLALVARCLS
jgi:arsenite-transporting ATPase